MADLAGYWPVTTAPVAIEVGTVAPHIITETFSGRTRRSGLGGQFYTFTLNYGEMNSIEHRKIQAFIAQAYGPQLSFEMVMPELSYTTSTNAPTGSTTASTTYSAGVKSVVVNTDASKRVLNAGDYFKFANHSKVYQCAADCDSNGSGSATLYFAGALVEDVPSGTGLSLTAVPFTCVLAGGENSYTVGIGGISSLTVAMRETW